VPGGQERRQWQVQVQADPSGLGSTPSQAFTRATRMVNRVERSLPGQVTFVDNLSERLNGAASDALLRRGALHHARDPGRVVGRRPRVPGLRSEPSSGDRASSRCCARAAPHAGSLLGLAGIESVVIGLVRRAESEPAPRSRRSPC